jgi:hypothetical protein
VESAKLLKIPFKVKSYIASAGRMIKVISINLYSKGVSRDLAEMLYRLQKVSSHDKE